MSRKMNRTSNSELLDHLISEVKELPAEQIVEVSDFVRDLRTNPRAQRPERGSLVAILQTLNRTGPLQFEADELETLLAEIETMRELDLDKNE